MTGSRLYVKFKRIYQCAFYIFHNHISIPVSVLKILISEVRYILLEATLLLVIIITLFVKKQCELFIMTTHRNWKAWQATLESS